MQIKSPDHARCAWMITCDLEFFDVPDYSGFSDLIKFNLTLSTQSNLFTNLICFFLIPEEIPFRKPMKR